MSYLIQYILFKRTVSTEISPAQIIAPIAEPIEKSELSVGLEEIVQIPNSGTDIEKAARLNLLTPLAIIVLMVNMVFLMIILLLRITILRPWVKSRLMDCVIPIGLVGILVGKAKC